eukprot:Skav215031  [mRNA]  locus=scaffold966:630697:632607:+ [translate_table: standard]
MSLPSSGTQPLHSPGILLPTQTQREVQHCLWIVLLLGLYLQRHPGFIHVTNHEAVVQNVHQTGTTTRQAVVDAVGGAVVGVVGFLPGHVEQSPSCTSLWEVRSSTVQQPGVHQQRRPRRAASHLPTTELLGGALGTGHHG